MTSEKEMKNVAMIIASVASFMAPFMISAINIALPAIEKEFTMDAVTLSWIGTSYLLASAVFLLPFGKLADIVGRKKVFGIGLLFFTSASLLNYFATSATMLIIFRVVQGIGGAMSMTTGPAIITSVVPRNERGKALGFTVASVYLGLSLGPFLGGMLTQQFGWRSIFMVVIPFGLTAAWLTFTRLKGEWAEAKGEKFDWIGSLIYGIALTGLIFGATRLPAIEGIVLSMSGIILFAVFYWIERKITHPVFEFQLFESNRVFAFSNIAALINYSATFAITFLLSLYLQYIKGLTVRQAGLFLVIQPIIQVIVSPLAGKLSDRTQPRFIASIGMTLTATGLFILSQLSSTTSNTMIIISLVVLGLGFALFSSPNMNAIMSSVEKRYYGIASGSAATMRLLGQMLSMSIATILFALFIGHNQINTETYPAFIKSIQIAFSVFGVLCLIGIFFSLIRGKMHRD